MTGQEGSSYVDIIFKARHTDVLERFRKHATAKLAKIEKLDAKVLRVDVEITEEHNPRSGWCGVRGSSQVTFCIAR